jgi:hypothetical protein
MSRNTIIVQKEKLLQKKLHVEDPSTSSEEGKKMVILLTRIKILINVSKECEVLK